MPFVPGFLPSTSGFHFSNSTFPNVPDIKIDVLGQQIGIGNAANGLCGGMAFAARDYFEAGIPIPPDTTNPSSGPLFDYIVRRLIDSFNLFLPSPPPLPPVPPFLVLPYPPFGPGPATYMWLMNPELPDHETVASNLLISPRGRAWVMINDVWPKIKADIDNGRLSPIAQVKIKSLDPTKMGNNHQVLAYGYDLDSRNNLVIHIYDPNHPNDNTVTMSLNIGNPQQTTPIASRKAPPCGVSSSPSSFELKLLFQLESCGRATGGGAISVKASFTQEVYPRTEVVPRVVNTRRGLAATIP